MASKKSPKKAVSEADEKDARRKYATCMACGTKMTHKGVAAWMKAMRRLLETAVEAGSARLPILYECGKCGRRSPVKSLLCKPRKLDL
jgi:hypothetical protein